MRTKNYKKNYTEKEIEDRRNKLEELQSKLEIKEYKKFKKRKQTKEKLWKSINIFIGSFGEGTWIFLGVVGFVLSQLFWVWLLRGFVTFFYDYLNQQSSYTLTISLDSFQVLFWSIYIIWLVIMIFSKFKFKISKE